MTETENPYLPPRIFTTDLNESEGDEAWVLLHEDEARPTIGEFVLLTDNEGASVAGVVAELDDDVVTIKVAWPTYSKPHATYPQMEPMTQWSSADPVKFILPLPFNAAPSIVNAGTYTSLCGHPVSPAKRADG